jgi:Rieske Fe-S protein
MSPELSLSRRRLLYGVAAAGVAAPLLAACGEDGGSTEQSNQGGGQDTGSDSGSDTGSDGGSDAGSEEGGGQDGSGGGTELAKTSDIPVGGGKVFADQQIVVTQPAEGDIQAFSAVCTHKGCPLEPKIAGGKISCSKTCGHGSVFNVDGTVSNGPAAAPLKAAKVTVDGDSILLA